MDEHKVLKERLNKLNQLLDKLDERLANGEIGEAKYKELAEKYKAEAENLKNQIAEKELLHEVGLKAEEKGEIAKEVPVEGTSYKKFLTVALVLGVLLLGYWALAPGASNAPESSKITPTSTPKTTASVTTTPKVTQTVSPAIASTPASEKTITNSIGMEFVLIPAGEFDMGSPANVKFRDRDEQPIHRVKISNAFYMGKYEVTQKQWREVMGTNPSYFKGDNLPVEQVSWNDVQEFVNKLNEKEGTNKYRLPSEAEWEYAARAGTTTIYSFGDDESNLGDYAWWVGNSGNKNHEVGTKKPNSWGLYDVHGNVWEWVQDKWHDNYNGAPIDSSAWEGSGSDRVQRGGGDCLAVYCRSAIRIGGDPVSRNGNLGFRLLRNP